VATLALIIVVLACAISGRLAVEFVVRKFGSIQADRLALLFIYLTSGVSIIGWLATLMAEVGIFSITLLGLTWLLLVMLLLGFLLNQKSRAPGSSASDTTEPDPSQIAGEIKPVDRWLTSDRLQYGLLVLWLTGAGWLFFRPHQYVLGAADAGVYVNLAASIADTGGILIDDPALAQLDQILKPALTRIIPGDGRAQQIAPTYLLPGFYVADPAAGRIIPQFYPLHPVWQAIAYSIGGLQASLLMTGLWALLGSLAVYLIIRQISNWPVALLVLVGLSLCALQGWFARYPTSEMLSQFLLWAGIWSTMLWLKGKRPVPFWGLVGGLALGQVLLVRIDSYFLVAVPAAIFLWLSLSGAWRRHHWTFFLPLILLTIHSLLHALTQSAPYFYSTFDYGLQLLRNNWWLPVGVLISGIIILYMLQRFRLELDQLARFRQRATVSAALLFVLLVFYGWFIRPNIGGEITSYDYWYGGGQLPLGLDRQNLVRLGWYLSPVGIVVATAGICQMILAIDRQRAILLATGLLFSLLYLWRIQANPHQVYTMRRYVPVVLPFAMVASGGLFGWLFSHRQRWWRAGTLILAGAWLAALGLSARGFITQIDYQGLVPQLTALDEQLEKESLLLFNDEPPIGTGDTLGTPLRFIYGHDVYRIHDWEILDQKALAEMILTWLVENRAVFWIGNGYEFLVDFGINPVHSFEETLVSKQLEGSYDHKPREIVEYSWQLSIHKLQ